MAISYWIQLECDYCGNCDYMPGKNTKLALSMFKDNGWLIRDGKHFDSYQCLSKYSPKQPRNEKE